MRTNIFQRFPIFIFALVPFFLMFTDVHGQDNYRSKSRGIPAYPFPAPVKQPDGSEIVLLAKGDRVLHWWETIDGYTVLKDSRGNYVYAGLNADLELVPTSYLVSQSKASVPEGLEKGLRFSSDQVNYKEKAYFGKNDSKANPSPFPSSGNNRVLVILAEFPDQPATATPAQIESLLNEADYNGTGSFRDYFVGISYGNLVLNASVSQWITVSHNMSYYGANDIDGYDIAPQELVREAIDQLELSGFDFSQFDNDNDGYVDEIMVFHTGYGEQFIDGGDTCIWSHAYHLGDLAVSYDGVILDNYIIGPELYSNAGSEITSIGTMVHEFAHSLAMPDLYDVDFEGTGGYAWDLNFWDLMAAGSWNNEGQTPAGINAWLKEHMGWMTIPEISSGGSYSLQNAMDYPEAFRINTPTLNEFYILENRQWYGFDFALPGYGMLVYHVDLNYDGWLHGNVNVDPMHQGLDLVEADNIRDSLTIDGDPFPGWDSVTSFTSYTSPALIAWNGQNLPFSILNISQADSIITFQILDSTYTDAPALWSVDTSAFSNIGTITASVYIGSAMASEGFLAAFMGSDCRGVAPVVYNPDTMNYVFELNVYSNVASGEAFSFKYYNVSLDSIYDLVETVDFIQGMSVGSANAPIKLHAPVEYSRSFNQGWNWFSLNVTGQNMTPQVLLSSCATSGDYIKSQTQSATYYAGFGWFGTMTAMNNNTLYLMNARAVCDMNYSGIPVDVTANPISIVPGWNWVAYQPQEAQTSSQALSSLTPSNLDYVKNQTRSTTYYAGYGWFGTLSQMSPGEGYMMNIASAGTLIFPEGASAKKSLYIDEDLTGYVDFNPYNFEFNGTITAEVNLSDMEISSEDVLIAYVNGECRGQVRGWYFEPTDKIVFPMMVYSNTAEGDELSFTYYSSLADEYYLCAEAMHFTQDMVTGDAEYPVVLTVSGVSNVNHSRPVTEFSVYPNPSAGNISVTFNIPGRSNVKLELIDITGKLVSCLVDEVFENGNYTLDLQKLNIIEGVYYLRFVLNETSCVQQITIIN